MEQQDDKTKKLLISIKNSILEFLKFAIIAAVIVLPIRMFVAQPFIVSGLSMFPTFDDGEYLIIDELSYNFKKPHRNDVIVFHYPKNEKQYFIKRIIGLPNETVLIKDGVVTIKNQEFPDGFVLEENYLNEQFSTNGIYTNGENDYFVMGDNRNHSSDSRIWGKVSEDLIVGRAYVRLLPIAHAAFLPGKVK